MNTVTPGEFPRAEDFNGLVEELRRITPTEGPLPATSAPFPHPWKCSVAPGAKPGEWKLSMRPGWVNDIEVGVAYLTENDPRQWQMPKDFPASRIHNGVAERSWRDPVDPPYILLTAAKDFTPVADGARPPAFCTEAAWLKNLSIARVFLSARPFGIINNRVVPSLYRTWAGTMPDPLTSYPYGIRELARIYLLSGPQPDDAQVFIQHREFWNLWAVPVDPITLFPSTNPINVSFGGYGFGLLDGGISGINIISDEMVNEVNAALANIGQSTSSVEFWSV